MTTNEDRADNRFVANGNNLAPRRLHTCPAYADDSANTSYTTTSTTWVEANAGTNSKVQFLISIPGNYARCFGGTVLTTPGTNAGSAVGIGVDSTSSASVVGQLNTLSVTGNTACETAAHFAVGYHYFDLLIKSNAAGGTTTFFADLTRSGSAADPKATVLEGYVMA